MLGSGYSHLDPHRDANDHPDPHRDTDPDGDGDWHAAGDLHTDAFSDEHVDHQRTPTATATPTLPALEPSGGDDKGAPGTTNRTREKDKDQQVTEERRQQDQRTNRYGQDQYRVEGNVKEISTVNGEPAIILANRDGDVVVILRCGGSCPTVKVGDYVVAEGEKEHEQLFYAESVSIEN